MRPVLTVARKELVEGLRDRRTLFFAFVYGPVLFPLFILVQIFLLQRSNAPVAERPVAIAVIGAETAPNLMARLAQDNLEAKPAPADYARQLRAGELDLVLEIPSAFGQRLSAGQPAPLVLHYNASRKDANRLAQQLRQSLWTYSAQLRQLRLTAHGVDGNLATPLTVMERDVSAEGAGGLLLHLMLYAMLMVTMTMAGFYNAIDSTAGERERQSLEPLLSLPVAHWQLALGKYLNVLVVMLAAAALAVLVLGLALMLLPLREFSLISHLGPPQLLLVLLIALPAGPLIAALQLWVAGRAKSVREAQAFLSILLMAPFLPLALSSRLAAAGLEQLLPFTSQFAGLGQLANGEALDWSLLVGAGTSLLLAAWVITFAVRAFARDNALKGG